MIRKPHTSPLCEPGHPLEELIRSARVCHPGWQTAGGVTFIPDFSLAPSWASWRDLIFLSALLPALEQARQAGAAGDLQELAVCDERLNRALPSPSSMASRSAGAVLAREFTVPAGERLLARYTERMECGEAPGHLAILLGLRAAVFHLPLATLFGVYVLLEAKGGLRKGGPMEWMEMMDDCLARRGDAGGSHLRAA